LGGSEKGDGLSSTDYIKIDMSAQAGLGVATECSGRALTKQAIDCA
jgi:hypothetical protein